MSKVSFELETFSTEAKSATATPCRLWNFRLIRLYILYQFTIFANIFTISNNLTSRKVILKQTLSA